MMRAVTSVALPALTGMMMRTGFDGQLCADAAQTLASNTTPAVSQRCHMNASRVLPIFVCSQRGARLARMRCRVRRCMFSRRAVSETLRPHSS